MKRVIFAILFMLVPAVCHADELKDAMGALKHLNGAALNGASCKDLAIFLEVAKSEVGYYLKGEETKQNKKIKEAMSETIHYYDVAQTFLCKIDRPNGLVNFGKDASPADNKITSEYFAIFPQDKKDVSEGGALINKQGTKLHLKTATVRIFKKASIKYDELTKSLK